MICILAAEEAAEEAVDRVRAGTLGRREERAVRRELESARVIARTAMRTARVLVVMVVGVGVAVAVAAGVDCCCCSVFMGKRITFATAKTWDAL